MLLDNIKRYSASAYFKLVNVEALLAKGMKLPPAVHSVPTLLFQESKTFIVGKQVFDYLLLPGKGFLLNLPAKGATAKLPGEASAPGSSGPLTVEGEPMSFAIHSKNMSSDAYSFIEDENSHDIHKVYNWSGVEENHAIPLVEEGADIAGGGAVNTETRTKKNLPDIGSIQSLREQELQTYLGTPMTGASPPGVPTR